MTQRNALLETLEPRIVLSVDAVAIGLDGSDTLVAHVGEVTIDGDGGVEGPIWVATPSGFQVDRAFDGRASIAPDGGLNLDDPRGDFAFELGSTFLDDAGTGLGWLYGADALDGSGDEGAQFVIQRPDEAKRNDLQGVWRISVYRWDTGSPELGYAYNGSLQVNGSTGLIEASTSNAGLPSIVTSLSITEADDRGKFLLDTNAGQAWGYLNADKTVFAGIDGNTSDGSAYIFLAVRDPDAGAAPTQSDIAGEYRGLFGLSEDFIDEEDDIAVEAFGFTLNADGTGSFTDLIFDTNITVPLTWTTDDGVVTMDANLGEETARIRAYASANADTLLPYEFTLIGGPGGGTLVTNVFGGLARLDNPAAPFPLTDAPDGPNPVNPNRAPGRLADVYAEVNDNGEAIAYVQNQQGLWFVSDLDDVSGTGDLASFDEVDSLLDESQGGRAYIAATLGEKVYVFVSGPSGKWEATDLTAIPGGIDAGDGVTIFQKATTRGRAAEVFITSLNADGDLILYTLRDGDWTARNLGQELRDDGMEMPKLEGKLTSYVTPWGALNVVALDGNGDIQTIWTAPAFNGKYRTDNLSAITGAPAYTGGLSVYLTSWNGINIVGNVGSGELIATWWVPSFGGDWQAANFNDIFGFPQLRTESIATFTTPWNALNIVGLDDEGDLVVFWWVPPARAEDDRWRVANLDDIIENGLNPADASNDVDLTGALTSSYSAVSRQITIAGNDVAGGAGRFVFDLDARSWSTQNLGRVSIDPFA